MRHFARHCAAWLLSVTLAAAALAQSPHASAAVSAATLPAPTQPVILTINGAITLRNGGDSASFDAAMIGALPAHEFRTWTPWFKEPATFRGPRLQSVLQAVGARGQTLRMVALNDYAVDVPVSDASRFEPILATHINGKLLGVRDKGPLFLIYPFDARPETRTDEFYGRSIWQVMRITVQ